MKATFTGILSLLICLSWVNICESLPAIHALRILHTEPFSFLGDVFGAKQCGGKWNFTKMVGENCDATKLCTPKDAHLYTQVGFAPTEDSKNILALFFTKDYQYGNQTLPAHEETINQEVKKGLRYVLDFYTNGGGANKVDYTIQLKKFREEPDLLCVQASIQYHQ